MKNLHVSPDPGGPVRRPGVFWRKAARLIVAFSCLLTLPALPLQASIITFDLLDPGIAGVLDNQASGEIVQEGLRANLAGWSFPGYQARFNQTASRFGINTIGTSQDSASLVDSFNGISEGLAISFSTDVLLEYIVLSLFSPGEEAQLSRPGQPFGVIKGLETAIDIFQLDGQYLAAGQNLLLGHRLGNGFSVAGFAVRSISVVEPAAWFLLLGFLPWLTIRLKSHRSSCIGP